MKYEKLTGCFNNLTLFANETRLQILCIIGKDRLTGVEILKQLDMKQSSLSYHLTLMVKANILNAENVWKWTYYTVNTEGIKEAIKSFRILNEVAK